MISYLNLSGQGGMAEEQALSYIDWRPQQAGTIDSLGQGILICLLLNMRVT